jgi:hypothetical protein
MSDGLLRTWGGLVGAGHSRSTIRRLVEEGVLVRQGARHLVHADSVGTGDARTAPLTPIAARFGGEPGRPRGIVCLWSAAVVHGLTDMAFDQLLAPASPGEKARGIDLALPRGTSRADGGLAIRLVWWSQKESFDEGTLEWREFGGHGIHVTNPARTVCDLFGPCRGEVPRGVALEALARLMADNPALGAEAVRLAGKFGWGNEIAAAHAAAEQGAKFGGPSASGF